MKKLSSSSGYQPTNRTASVSNIHAPVVLRIAAALGQRQHQKLCGERSFEKMVRNQVALPGIAAPPRSSVVLALLLCQRIILLSARYGDYRPKPTSQNFRAPCCAGGRSFGSLDWQPVFSTYIRPLSDNPDFEYLIVDTTIVRAHQHATGAKKEGLKINRPGLCFGLTSVRICQNPSQLFSNIRTKSQIAPPIST